MSQKTEISGHTHLISLLGSPIRHSMSPATHNLSFEKLGVDSIYIVFDVKQDDLPDIIAAMKRMDGWDGSNVTMPCKQAIIPLLDGLSDSAELMGAVNVLKKEDDGRITGHNTDGTGMMQNIRNHGEEIEGKTLRLLVLVVQVLQSWFRQLSMVLRRFMFSHVKAVLLILVQPRFFLRFRKRLAPK